MASRLYTGEMNKDAKTFVRCPACGAAPGVACSYTDLADSVGAAVHFSRIAFMTKVLGKSPWFSPDTPRSR